MPYNKFMAAKFKNICHLIISKNNNLVSDFAIALRWNSLSHCLQFLLFSRILSLIIWTKHGDCQSNKINVK